MIKKLLITAVLATFAVSANANDKITPSQLKELANNSTSYLTHDGKARVSVEYHLDDDGKVRMTAKKQYLPAVTDGKNYTPKSSYFAISPKTLKYIGKIGKATNVVGISMLMVDVLGEGVDWALDPANNSVKYNMPATSSAFDDACYKHFSNQYLPPAHTLRYARFSRHTHAEIDGNIQCLVKLDGFPEWDMHMWTPIDKDTRVMSDEEFEQKIRDLAKAGNINAKQVILDAGKDEIITGKHDEAVERLADDISTDDTTDETQPDNPPSDDDETTSPNPDDKTTLNPDGTADKDAPKQDPETSSNFELPPFCSWATIVCEFIGTKPDMPDEPLPTKDIQLKTPAEFDKDYIDFGGQCPADINVDIDLAFAKHTISYSFTPICDFVQNYLRIVILIGAYIFATIHISSAFKI